ncbi:hypothetical protein GYMLUDRAFT_589331 [Collybiopsis luxurians FD-317 M1]|uniref:Uncharacterized protein n=1 Tax=Collybiopsis luxurians FD-317 M1 TaxID=944289 RepID=A0A0D0BZ38_9AGAR|nr:hypothetical protein GYMLUDRAFT_589331 [Collybiopsis luxurians FD-317 M1]
MSKVYAGLGSDKPEALLDVMSSRLALRESGGGAEEAVEYAVQDLAFSHDLYVNLDPAFGEALRRAEGYWKNAFELMLPTASSSPSSSSDTNPPADALDAPASTQLSQAALTLLLKLVLQKPDSEVAEVTQTWIRAGLFDMFDKNMGAVVRAPGAASTLICSVFPYFTQCQQSFPSLRTTNIPLHLHQRIRVQLPSRTPLPTQRRTPETKNRRRGDQIRYGAAGCCRRRFCPGGQEPTRKDERENIRRGDGSR